MTSYFYEQQGLPIWQQMGMIGPQFAQLHGGAFGNPGLAAYGQHYGQYGAQSPFGAFGHNSGWGGQPQWGMQSPFGMQSPWNMQAAWGQGWGQGLGQGWGQQHRQLSPYDVNEVVRQLVPALPQILAQAQQSYPGVGYAAYGQGYGQGYGQLPRTLTPQDVNDVVRQLLPLLPQIVGALQGQQPQHLAMHGGLGAQNPFAMQTQQPFQQPLQQPWASQHGALGQLGQYGAPQFQSAFGGPQQWGPQQWSQSQQRQLTQQDVADVSRQLAALIPQVIGNLQAFNQQRVM